MDYERILTRMQEKYRELTGFSADNASDIGIRLKVLAGETAALYGEMETLYSQVSPQTAAGAYLDMHAETRAIRRKPAQRAEGVLRFTREIPAGFDIPLPAGILCATRSEPQLYFETSADAVLPAGQSVVDVPSAAVEAGAAGNVAPGQVCLMIASATGLTAVTNLAAFSGGVDAEEDNALRSRLLSSYANISNTTNAAYYYDAAMSDGEVVSARVLPRKRGRGKVDVVIACRDASGEAAAAQRIAEMLAREKEINVDVAVYPAVRDLIGVEAEIAVATDADFELVRRSCADAVAGYMASLGVGEALLLSCLGREILGVEGVYNYRILFPAADVTPGEDHVIFPGDVSLDRMEAV